MGCCNSSYDEEIESSGSWVQEEAAPQQRVQHIKKRQKSSARRTGSVLDRYEIQDRATGYSYYRVFSPYLGDHVTEVEVDEPYLRETYQLYNLLAFCKLLENECRNLKSIHVTTVDHLESKTKREIEFQNIQDAIASKGVILTYEYDKKLHDRCVRLNEDREVIIGRGLHFFYGAKDYSKRQCRLTNVAVYEYSFE